MDTYGHLWPDKDESTKAVIDAVTVYPYAFGSAMAQMRDLLAILDEMAPASGLGGAR